VPTIGFPRRFAITTVQHSNGVRIVDQANDAFMRAKKLGRDAARIARRRRAAAATVVPYMQTSMGRRESNRGRCMARATPGRVAMQAAPTPTANGPDRVREMIRFFFALPRAGSA